MSPSRATLVGFGAVLNWSLLAVLTVRVGPVPPFQLAAMGLALGGVVGLLWIALAGRGLGALRGIAPAVWAVGIGGIFGYHCLYFTALAYAPAAQATLVNYLWPLFIVLFSGLLPGERLRPLHLAGAALAFAGAVLVLVAPGAGGRGAALGYAAAFGCAVVWAGYSLASRRLGRVPTETVAVFCLVSALLAAAAHLLFETSVRPADAGAWTAMAALGLGPLGLAFYLWDIGVKRGDIQLLGTASYAAPVLSTLALVLAGEAEATAGLALAALMIAGGAALAAGAGRRAPPPAGPLTPGGTGARSLPSGGASAP